MMNKDLKLIRTILEATRDKKPDGSWVEIDFPNYDPAIVVEHVRLLDDEGYIEAIDLSCIGHIDWRPQRLTNSGHDYLESLSKPLYKTAFEKSMDVSGKMLWIFVGGLIGGVGTYVATLILGACK
jgi:hypothetical protein